MVKMNWRSTKTFGICLLLGVMSIMSLFACTPIEPNKVPLGSTLINQSGLIGYWNFDETALGTTPRGASFADRAQAISTTPKQLKP